MNVRLAPVTEDNFFALRAVEPAHGQKGFCDNAAGILARGYLYRDANARVFAIEADGAPVGLMLVKEFSDEPVGYDLQQFLIDARYQNKGIGTAALRLLLEYLERERRFDTVEVCVKATDAIALTVYRKAGFADSGYIDPDCPDCVNLIKRL